jgi:3-oxoacyl-[acyl-carrier-protein] synthase II
MGLITPLGSTVDDLWTALLAGETAAREWGDLAQQGFRITTACRIPDFAGQPRGRMMAVSAAREAVDHAGISLNGHVGVYVGTTMGESLAFERAAEGHPFVLEQAAASAYPHELQQALGVEGPAYAYGTACAAGNYAIGAAAEAVRMGRVDAAIAGGVDAFSRIAMVGFSRSRAMSPERCRPFDAERRGMQLGEAAAFVVIEREDAAKKRGAQIYAAVTTLGLSCDAYHATAPRPDGTGMATAMENALRQGKVSSDEIGFICAHGTGTRVSDAAEALAIHSVFAHRPPVSGFKGALGHSLGAATAVEAVITALALHQRTLPPTANLRQLDPEIQIDVVTEPRETPNLRWALNCGYAFGGLNSALLMEAA